MFAINSVFVQITVHLIAYPVYKLFLSKHLKQSLLKEILNEDVFGISRFMYIEVLVVYINMLILLYISKNIVSSLAIIILISDFLILEMHSIINSRDFGRIRLVLIPMLIAGLLLGQFDLLFLVRNSIKSSLNFQIVLMMGLTIVVSVIETIRLKTSFHVSEIEKMNTWVDAFLFNKCSCCYNHNVQ